MTAPTLAGVIDNIEAAERAAADVIMHGHYPFVPHHSWSVDTTHTSLSGEALSHQWWIDWCCAWIDHCDAVYRIGASPGADKERDYAARNGIPVVTDLAELEGVTR